MNNKLKPISVKDLVAKKFHIAFYQRGYRWKKKQVYQLLEDLKDFQPTEAVPHYFLQVLICSQRGDDENELNVVDGQQRLTTIDLILKACQSATTFSLECERDQNNNERGALDKHFIEIAENTIKEWFSNHKDYETRIKQTLLDAEFLVYYLQKDNTVNMEAMENEVFDRINSGKISAKDSELVKCVMLTVQSDEPADVTHRRATEWDEIERALNDEDFYAFLTPHGARDVDDRFTRIFIAAGYKPIGKIREDYTFPYLANIQRVLNLKEKKISRQAVWANIRNAFSRLQAWYQDNLTYHAIGWWIHRDRYGDGLGEIDCLKDIMESLDATHNNIDDLVSKGNLFYKNTDWVWNALFLFNLAYACVRQHLRYNFRGHRGISPWSIEHVMASSVRVLTQQEFETYRRFASKPEEFSWEKYQNECQAGRDENEKKQLGEQYIQRMLTDKEYFAGEDDSLGNLTLLPKNANSLLNDDRFIGKRSTINSLDKDASINSWDRNASIGSFVPPATAAVFNKLFKDMDPLKPYLSESDKDAYIKAIQEIIDQFVNAVHKYIEHFEIEGKKHA